MSFDLFAEHGPGSIRGIATISQDAASNGAHRVQLLAAASLSDQRELAKRHYESLVQSGVYAQQVLRANRSLGDAIGLAGPRVEDLGELPAFGWLLSARFQLEKPYLSRDDSSFYPIDSPILKDHVLRLPMVAASGWKGAIRAAASRLKMEALSSLADACTVDQIQEARRQLFVLFGAEAGSFARHWNRFTVKHCGNECKEKNCQTHFEEFLKKEGLLTDNVSGHQGRLYFFPTFFDRIGFEMLNPHSRSRRVGKDLVAIECVPTGAGGTLDILYVPYDHHDSQWAAEDAETTAGAVRYVLRQGGFGAKTSSGFGIVREGLAAESGISWREEGRVVKRIAAVSMAALGEIGKQFREALGQ